MFTHAELHKKLVNRTFTFPVITEQSQHFLQGDKATLLAEVEQFIDASRRSILADLDHCFNALEKLSPKQRAPFEEQIFHSTFLQLKKKFETQVDDFRKRLHYFGNQKNFDLKVELRQLYANIDACLELVTTKKQALIADAGFICECNSKVVVLNQILHSILLNYPDYWIRVAKENFLQNSMGCQSVKLLVQQGRTRVERDCWVPIPIAAMIAVLPKTHQPPFDLQQFALDDYSDGIFRDRLRQICAALAATNQSRLVTYEPYAFYYLIKELSRLKDDWSDWKELDRIRNTLLTFEREKLRPYQLAVDAKRLKLIQDNERQQQATSGERVSFATSLSLPSQSIFNLLQYIGGFNYRPTPEVQDAVADNDIFTDDEMDEDDEELLGIQQRLEYVKSAYRR